MSRTERHYPPRFFEMEIRLREVDRTGVLGTSPIAMRIPFSVETAPAIIDMWQWATESVLRKVPACAEAVMERMRGEFGAQTASPEPSAAPEQPLPGPQAPTSAAP